MASQPVTAASQGDTLTFGGDFVGSPTDEYALKLVNQNQTNYQFGLISRADADLARAIAGYADNASGSSIGVLGRNDSSDGTGVSGISRASSGSTRGIFGTAESPDGTGLYVTNTEETDGPAYGCHAQTNSKNGTALIARAIYSDSNYPGTTVGVKGKVESTGDGTTAVVGEATGGSGITTGVRGTVDSATDGATGVHGETTTNENDVQYGVRGTAVSGNQDAAGVKGEASNGATGVYGEAGTNTAYGVRGANTATTGTDAEGVFGTTSSPDSPAITGKNTAGGTGVRSEGTLDVDGHVDVGDVGLSAHLNSDQGIPDDTEEVVAFDGVDTDHFNGLTNNVYQVGEAGHYHVSFTIGWDEEFGNNETIEYKLQIDDGAITNALHAVTTAATSGHDITRNFSRTLFDLSSGDEISVTVWQNSGDPRTISSDNERTHLTIYKVG